MGKNDLYLEHFTSFPVNHEYEPDESAVEPVEKEQPNLASSAKVSSSTVMYGAAAGLATDGNVESNFFRYNF